MKESNLQLFCVKEARYHYANRSQRNPRESNSETLRSAGFKPVSSAIRTGSKKQRRAESNSSLLVQSETRYHYATSQQNSSPQNRTESFCFKGTYAATTTESSAP